MEGQFPYIKLKGLEYLIGEPDEDTRVFRQGGTHTMFRSWVIDLKRELKGNLIPSTWVPDFVGVSRAAVHKRIKAGRLTMFVFELEEPQLNILGRLVSRRKDEFSYCVQSECNAWWEEIVERQARRHPPEFRG